NWRLMAFGCLSLAAVVIGDDIRARSRSTVTPFVVEVDRLGAVQAVAPATPDYQPTEQQVAYFLGRFITNARGISIDPVVVRQAWLDAYAQITSHAKPVLDEYARVADPFGKIGRRAVTIDVTSVVRASDRSFRIAWVEHPYVDGAPLPAETWSAILTVAIQTPRTEARLRQNPLGIYIDAISWAQELGPRAVVPGVTP
ncbi:MAG: conjugal transfer protein TrbF, partial [Rhodopila sp.]|nr:conjugal transfer protein TrbF [Rhodopila sp.]